MNSVRDAYSCFQALCRCVVAAVQGELILQGRQWLIPVRSSMDLDGRFVISVPAVVRYFHKNWPESEILR
jgi:hypothetical protein